MWLLLKLSPRAALAAAVVVAAMAPSGCSTAPSSAEPTDEAQVQTVQTVSPSVEPLERLLRVTGTLVADEQAEVSAEVPGRVTGTPVERGSRVQTGSLMVQLSTENAAAQLAEAEANAAQIAAGLDIADGGAFDVERVPDVANARASLTLAQAEFDRIRSLLEERVVSQSEFDQRQTSVEAARQKYEAERNKARQNYRAWQGARARIDMARKGLNDTAIKAPFAGLVAERLVSAGDFVTTGTRVATVVRIDPLRVMLTVPERFVALVQPGQTVSFGVDAFPSRTFEGVVRFISPAVRPDQRALTVEALVPNPTGELKPGLFATAQLAQPAERALMLTKKAIHEVGRTSRVFVVAGDRLEERIVTLGQDAGDRVEVADGLDASAVVALPGTTALTEGLKVRTMPVSNVVSSN